MVRNNKGESLIETLVAMVVTVLALIMIAGAIMSSSRLNAAVKDTALFASMDKSAPASSFSLSIDGSTYSNLSELEGYEENGFYFYDYK